MGSGAREVRPAARVRLSYDRGALIQSRNRATRRPSVCPIAIGCGIAIALLLTVSSGLAQEGDGDSAPPSVQFTLPIEFDFDHGAANGNAVIGRFLPVVVFDLGKQWKLINLTLAAFADAPGGIPGQPGNPEPIPGPRVVGLMDWTNVVFFTPPSKSSKLVWGIGPAFTLPIATDEALGSGKWSAGPALRIAYRPGKWNLGLVAANLRSYTGSPDRADIHQLLLRGLIRRQFGDRWYFTYNPIVTANWNAASGQRWLVPVGGGFGRSFDVGSKRLAASLHYYANVVRPDGAPAGAVRIAFVIPVPKAFQR